MASDIASDSDYSEKDEQSSQSEEEYDEELVTEQPKAQEVKGKRFKKPAVLQDIAKLFSPRKI